VDATSRRRVRSIRAAQRGMSIIEAMIASVVLLIGLMGVFQGLLVASRQNANANQATRASGVASQVRGELDTLGGVRVVGVPGYTGLLTGADCNPSMEVAALTGGLEKLRPVDGEAWAVRCIFDLDAYERSVPDGHRLLPGYTEADFGRFRRVLVMIEKPDEVTGVPIHQVIIVVSWMEMTQRRYVRQYVSFYNSGSLGNETHVEI
jgi:hypothetical protein